MAAFSLTVPLTRLAVADEGLTPLFAGAGRAVVAALLAAAALALTRQALPRGRQWLRVAVVSAGVVIGFPVLTSLALTTTSASHSAVVIALLPAATATAVVLRTRERRGGRGWGGGAGGAGGARGGARRG
ncbi:EamA family transporter, partial [Nocardiopsis alba]|uniref:EamA family transporter n=1 Tax=Nocardiopsis alba TaxID=53437 RepID=UPI003410B3BC